MSNAFLSAVAPKGKSIKFPNVGDSFTGIVSAPWREEQETEYQPGGGGAPKFYPKSGQPIMQQIIPLDDVSAPSKDEAASTLYVSSPRMRRAIGAALQEAGATEPQVGGTLQVTFTGYGTGKNPSAPPKEYSAKYKAPEAPAGGAWGAQG